MKSFNICFNQNLIKKNILNNFEKWTKKYKKYISFNKKVKCNFHIEENDLVYFDKLKKSFKKYIEKNFKLKENKIYYLSDKKIGLNYQKEDKIRPYYIKKWETKANKKVKLFPISSKPRENLKLIIFNKKKSYINVEEPIIVGKYQVFKANIKEKTKNKENM